MRVEFKVMDQAGSFGESFIGPVVKGVDRLRLDNPTVGRDFAAGIDLVDDVLPECIKIRGAGEQAGHPNHSYGQSWFHYFIFVICHLSFVIRKKRQLRVMSAALKERFA